MDRETARGIGFAVGTWVEQIDALVEEIRETQADTAWRDEAPAQAIAKLQESAQLLDAWQETRKRTARE